MAFPQEVTLTLDSLITLAQDVEPYILEWPGVSEEEAEAAVLIEWAIARVPPTPLLWVGAWRARRGGVACTHAQR